MGPNPNTNSALNKYLQSWDCHNLFSSAPMCSAQRLVQSDRAGRRARYWTADAIKNRYVKNPGPLVSA